MRFCKKIYYFLIAISLILTLQSEAPKEGTNVTNEQKENKSEGRDFIRFIESETSASLETASAKYTHKDGTKVELIGVVHIADKAYYEQFNEQFKQYDALLYEMVGGDPDKPLTKEDLQANKKNPMRFFQLLIGGMMKLDFQLDHIDYTAKNFIHADMTLETFQSRQKAKGENLLSLLEKSIKAQEEAASQNKNNFNFASMFKLLNDEGGPNGMKLALGRQFHDIESMIGGMEGPDGSVLVAERNITALKVMAREIKSGKKNLGIFYGAAHLPDFDKRLTKELGFQKAETSWNAAWKIQKAAGKNSTKNPKASQNKGS
jgi:hypothetical protein